MTIVNPNPRYFRCESAMYIVDFEKIAMIFVERVQIGIDVDPLNNDDVISACIVTTGADKAFRLMTPRVEFIEMLSAFEKWLSGR